MLIIDRAGVCGGSPPPPTPGPLPGEPLFVSDEGNFARITEGSYVSADLQTVAWFAGDIPRLGIRGQLFERGFINYARNSVEVGTAWQALNGAGVGKVAGSAAPGTAPDGSTPAIMTYGNISNSRLTQTVGTGIPDALAIALVGFFRGVVDGRGNQPAINASVDATVPIPNGTWARHVKLGVSGVAISDVVYFDNDTTTQVVDAFACCLNDGRYPMTPTRSLDTTFTTFPDNLTFLSAQVPLYIREDTWSVTVTPEWAPNELISGEERWIITFGAAGDAGLRFRHNGASVRLEAVVGGLVFASSNIVAGAIRESTLVITVYPTTGEIDVNGSTGPVGTPWVWPGGVQMRLGGALGLSTSQVDAYVQVPVAA